MEDLRQAALGVIRSGKFPMLATCGADRQPRVRPISPLRVDGFVVYFANLLRYGKTAEIEQNAAVELCYLSPEHHQVRITGRAERVTDAELLKSLWEGNALLRKYLGSLENPELIIYVVQPQAIRYMREWELAYAEVPL